MTFTINIDMDRKCRKCHKGGATTNGLCLACISKGIKRGDYDHILKPLADKARSRIKTEEP
jgi:DNA-binding cell septation regulator SpoVG